MDAKKELTNFCQSTSMKGVPRILKSNEPCLKVTWCVCVVTFVTLAIYQCWSLLHLYFEYPVTTSIKEETTKQIQLPPDITVCNVNPFSGRKQAFDGVVKPQDYRKLLENNVMIMKDKRDKPPPQEDPGDKNSQPQSPPQQNFKLESLESELATVRGYYQYIGDNDAMKVGHKKHDLILQCELLSGNTAMNLDLPCENYTQTRLIQHPDYFNCYTIMTMDNVTEVTNETVYGASFLVHLDQAGERYLSDLRKSGMEHDSYGAKVIIHERNSAPFTSYSTDVSPGQFTRISVTLTERLRMSHPYGDCIENQVTETSLNELMETNKFNYSQDACLIQCTQESINKKCNCTDPYLVIPSMESTQFPFCGKFGDDVNLVCNRLVCAKAAKKAAKHCTSACPLPCYEHQYQVSSSTLKWPSIQAKVNLFDKLSRYPPGKAMPAIEQVRKESEGNMTLARQILLQDDFIDRHFVKVQVFYRDFKMMSIIDAPTITFVQLVSQLGGILNLWAGITVVLMVEVAELFYHLLKKWASGRQTNVKMAFLGVGSSKVHPMEKPKN